MYTSQLQVPLCNDGDRSKEGIRGRVYTIRRCVAFTDGDRSKEGLRGAVRTWLQRYPA